MNADEPIPECSPTELLENPDKYDGRRVRVRGYFHFNIEHVALYPTRNDFEAGRQDRSFWVGLPGRSEYLQKVGPYVFKYVEIDGVYVPGPGGHMMLWKGKLQATSFRLLPGRSDDSG